MFPYPFLDRRGQPRGGLGEAGRGLVLLGVDRRLLLVEVVREVLHVADDGLGVLEPVAHQHEEGVGRRALVLGPQDLGLAEQALQLLLELAFLGADLAGGGLLCALPLLSGGHGPLLLFV